MLRVLVIVVCCALGLAAGELPTLCEGELLHLPSLRVRELKGELAEFPVIKSLSVID